MGRTPVEVKFENLSSVEICFSINCSNNHYVGPWQRYMHLLWGSRRDVIGDPQHLDNPFLAIMEELGT